MNIFYMKINSGLLDHWNFRYKPTFCEKNWKQNFISCLSVTVSISGHKIEIRIRFIMFIKNSGSLKCYLLETVNSLTLLNSSIQFTSSIVQFLQCSEVSFVHPSRNPNFAIALKSKSIKISLHWLLRVKDRDKNGGEVTLHTLSTFAVVIFNNYTA